MIEAFGRVRELLERALLDDVFPGFSLDVRRDGAVVYAHHGGQAELRPCPRPVTEETPWDLASLTKVLATTALAMRAVEDGLDLETEIQHRLPDAPAGVTVRHLLQHSSGLPPWVPLYERGLPAGTASTRAALLHQARQAPLLATPGSRHAYSDLGMMTLGAFLEAEGERLDHAWERRVRAPLGLDLRWGWPGAAATEDCPVRKRMIVGEVHDLNAAWLSGIAPHAGLFGTAATVGEFASHLLRSYRGQGPFQPTVVRRFWTEAGPGSHRLGWDSPTPGASSAGPLWPPNGVGHLGFTGCSLWIAPDQGISVVLLSNRVHPTVEGGSVPGQDGPRIRAMRALRPALHSAIWEVLSG